MIVDFQTTTNGPPPPPPSQTTPPQTISEDNNDTNALDLPVAKQVPNQENIMDDDQVSVDSTATTEPPTSDYDSDEDSETIPLPPARHELPLFLPGDGHGKFKCAVCTGRTTYHVHFIVFLDK